MPFKFQDQMKPNSHGLLAVSIGQKNQTGDRFLEEVQAVLVNPQLTTVSVLKADSVQRFHLIAKGMEPETALQQSLEAGKQWENDNKTTLELLKSKGGTIYSYEDFREASAEKYTLVKNLYERDKTFNNSVKSIAGNFCKRIKEDMQGATYDRTVAFKAMVDFLLEESAVYVYLSEHEAEFDYELYPAELPTPVLSICKELIENNLMKHITLQYQNEKKQMNDVNGHSFQSKAQRWNLEREDMNSGTWSLLNNGYNQNDIEKEQWLQDHLIAYEFIVRAAIGEDVDVGMKKIMANGLLLEVIKTIKMYMAKTKLEYKNKAASTNVKKQSSDEEDRERTILPSPNTY